MDISGVGQASDEAQFLPATSTQAEPEPLGTSPQGLSPALGALASLPHSESTVSVTATRSKGVDPSDQQNRLLPLTNAISAMRVIAEHFDVALTTADGSALSLDDAAQYSFDANSGILITILPGTMKDGIDDHQLYEEVTNIGSAFSADQRVVAFLTENEARVTLRERLLHHASAPQDWHYAPFDRFPGPQGAKFARAYFRAHGFPVDLVLTIGPKTNGD